MSALLPRFFHLLLAPTSPSFGLNQLWSFPIAPRSIRQAGLTIAASTFSYTLFLKFRVECRDWILGWSLRQIHSIHDEMRGYIDDVNELTTAVIFMELPFAHEEDGAVLKKTHSDYTKRINKLTRSLTKVLIMAKAAMLLLR
ncbi:hypothetical protein D9757_011115 [Collybiopsis confluens]|uniref:Uncharacterized protein n=1 Tax=Collybiopsis confluens TaxID=2823264 RepID=A0A8H5GXJ1_9AGAR|nr:hypothetical protein D9757_011115 [Collybiopsis confluens]